MDKFEQAFANNFYLTEEWAKFCATVAGLPLQKQTIGGRQVFTLGNKNISLSNYSTDECGKFKKDRLHYFCVLPEVNSEGSKSSLMEYSILHKTTYEQAFKNYKTSFFHGLREGRKFPHTVRVVRQPDEQLIVEIYRIYRQQMERHNSVIFPLSFFQTFLASPSALLFLIEYDGKIIAYFCCFQNQDNLYASIGGGHPEYFRLRASNKLYDELIRYACENKLNIHLGIGETGAGYQKFKHNAGLIGYKTERYPRDDFQLKLAFFLVRFKVVGWIFRLLSTWFPSRVVFTSMPFT